MSLNKSLAALDALADEVLKKSKGKDEGEDLTPEEISDKAKPDLDDTKEEQDEKAEEELEEEETQEKEEKPAEEDEELEKSDDMEDEEGKEIEKSDDGELDEDEELEKSDDMDDEDLVVDEVEDDDEELEKSDDEPVLDEDKEVIEKSIRGSFEKNPVLNKSLNSEVMSALVDVITKSLTDISTDLYKSQLDNNHASTVLAKSLQANIELNKSLQEENKLLKRRLIKLNKSINEQFRVLNSAINELSNQPVGLRKSVVSINDRDFGSSIQGVPLKPEYNSLNKSQVLSVLNNELYSGNPMVTANDIISYESGAPLRQDLQMLVANKLK